jgi:hypothetical protein
MEIENILKSFEIYNKKYQRDAVDAAIAQREEITPHLIAVLENVLEQPEKFADKDDDYYAHIYAFMLLGHFCETRAHDVIVDLFSLPDKLPSNLFSDIVTGDLPIVLLRTCGTSTERIKDLILDKNAYEYCRGSALQALSYTLLENYISREEIVSFYGELFSPEYASPESAFHDILATCVCDIYPEELMTTIERSYEEELIWPGYIGKENFTEVLKESKEKQLENLKNKMLSRQLDDIHRSMSWWACFEQPRKKTSALRLSGKKVKNKKQKKKAKKSRNKQAKASKRANRKKK